MPENKKAHLTLDDRMSIEEGLKEGLSFRAIARELDVSPTTVSNEIRSNRHFVKSKGAFGLSPTRCAHYQDCTATGLCFRCESKAAACKRCQKRLCFDWCKNFERYVCGLLDKAPFVCALCRKRRICSFDKALYKASKAHSAYKQRLSEAHIGVGCSAIDMQQMVTLVKKLLAQGHSLEAIWAVHAGEFPVGVRTFYNYMDKGIMGLSNMELPRKVRYRKRKKKDEEHQARLSMEGRTYADWKELSFAEQIATVQIDCVEGKKSDSKVIYSLHFPRFEFQIYLLIECQTQAAIKAATDKVQAACKGTFTELFPLLLADRGSEFLDFEKLEGDSGGHVRTRLYYCDPVKPGQKGSCEKNHEELRKILPKGMFSFDALTQKDVSLICSHVNSYPRPGLGGNTPYGLASQVLPASLLEALGIVSIGSDEVIMKPGLLKAGK